MSDWKTLILSHDEALVLFGLLERFKQSGELSLDHGAEAVALSRIFASLDASLFMETIPPDYDAALAQARQRLSSHYSGPQSTGVA